jgi:hypothetical protein
LHTAFCSSNAINDNNVTRAQAAMDGANGIDVDGRNIRVAFASEKPQGASAARRVLRVGSVFVRV